MCWQRGKNEGRRNLARLLSNEALRSRLHCCWYPEQRMTYWARYRTDAPQRQAGLPVAPFVNLC